jgi:hypothetical protein
LEGEESAHVEALRDEEMGQEVIKEERGRKREIRSE